MKILSATSALSTIAALTFATSVDAATFTTGFNVNQIVGGECENIDTNGAITTCRKSGERQGHRAEAVLQTRVENGNFGIKADLIVFGTDDPLKVSAAFQARVAVTYEDTVTFEGIDNGTFIIPIDLAGTAFSPAPSASENFVGVIGQSATDFQFDANFRNAQGGFEGGSLFREQRSGTTFINTPANNTVTEVIGSKGIQNVLFPIINGKAEFSVVMQGGVHCVGSFTAATPCRASIDFLNSARFLAASVQDANGNNLSNVAFNSTSGFDYLTGVEPHNVSAVPLPASGMMLIAGILGFAGVSRRRKTA